MMFDYIFKILSEDRLIVYIGLTALIIAIIVAIATIISQKKDELSKRVILDKTQINILLTDSVIVLSLIWLIRIIEKMCLFCKISYYLYYFCETIALLEIILISIKFINVFNITIKIIVNSDYKKELFKHYILKNCKKYDEQYNIIKNISNTNSNELKKLAEKYKDNFEILEYLPSSTGFNKLNLGKNGYIEKINVKILEKIINESCYNKQIIYNSEEQIKDDSKNDKKIILTRLPLEEINEETPVFYYNFKIDKEKLLKTIKIDDKNIIMLRGLEKSFEELFKHSSDYNYFDKDNYLKDVYRELLKLDNKAILDIFYEELLKGDFNYFNSYKAINSKILLKIKNKIDFLVGIYIIAKDNDNDECIELCDYINKISLNILSNVYNSKKFAYYYSENILNIMFLVLGDGKSDKIYSKLLSCLLSIIVYLINANKIDEVLIIVKNLYIYEFGKSQSTINFDFIIGIIKLYLVLLEKDKENKTNNFKNNVDKLSDIFENIKERFFEGNLDFNTICLEAINDRKKCGEINTIINFIEYNLLKDEYSNKHFGFSQSNYEIAFYSLLVLLKLSNYTINIDNINMDYNLKKQLEMIKDYKENEEIIKVLNIEPFEIEILKRDYLVPVIEKLKTQEHEKLIKMNLTNEIINVKNLLSEILNINNIIDENYVTIKRLNTPSSISVKYSSIYNKDYFKNFLVDKNRLTNNYKESFKRAIIDEIDRQLESAFKCRNVNLDNYLRDLKNKSKYIMITDQYMYNKLGDKYKNIRVFNILNSNGIGKGRIYLINKKDLPIIELHTINKNDKKINVENIFNDYQYITIRNLMHKDKVIVDDKELSRNERKEYICISVSLSLEIKLNANSDINCFDNIH